jgi:flagellar hook protein FlgE
MSIGSALQTGVNGLKAQSTKLATISDNIANSATVGYKRSSAEFSSLVVNTGSSSSYTAGGVATTIRTEVSKQGTILGSSEVTDLAIAGGGFFAVAGDPAGNNSALTRAGSFRADQFGNLVNPGGWFLQGFALNPDGTYAQGTPSLTTFGSMETINLSSIQGTAQATTQLGFAGNIPADNVGPFQASMQYYDEFGANQSVTLNWVNAGPNVWNLEIYENNVAPGNLITSLNGIDFSGAGGPPAVAGTPDFPAGGPTAAALPGYAVGGYVEADGTFELTVPGGSGTQTISISLGSENGLNGITQFGGDFTPQTNIDGSPLGKLQEIDIDDAGTMFAIFDNGEVRPIYQIPLVDVINPEGLTAIDGNAFSLSANSGDLRVATAGTNNTGSISAGALEGANVDIAEELTTLIETQRAYSSAATVVQTAAEMLEEVNRIGR